MKDTQIREAVELFEEVMIYGTERILRTVDNPLWNEYSREQIQLLKILDKEGGLTSRRLASLQNVHKSAISSRIKKLLNNQLIQIVETNDKREKLLELTTTGRSIVRESDQVLTAYIHHLLADRIDEEEIEPFLSTFRKLRKFMRMDEV
jgi:DNA-binding MarR family transcriptional regulator